MKIFDATLGTLERALDARLLRHNVLAGNLANADTPGYVPRDVDFAQALREGTQETQDAPPVPKKALDLVSAGHAVEGSSGQAIPLEAAGSEMEASSPRLVATQSTGAGLDGNAVDVDRALAAVAENAIQYNAAARAAGKKLAILRYVASDGTA
ncbi:MAG TPA: flagellar basal body rod protein FlgB [Anaeromyxobacteraceae bacterium]|nr:flagellar basal body rod protein FlgB [Anaeromyxobacteraceae bacterium]